MNKSAFLFKESQIMKKKYYIATNEENLSNFSKGIKGKRN